MDERRNDPLITTGSGRHLNASAHSTFVLDIPDFQPPIRRTETRRSAATLHEDLQLIGERQALDEDSRQFGFFDSPISLKDLTTTNIVQISTRRKALKDSRYGISYPKAPFGATKRIARSFVCSSDNRRSEVNKDILDAIIEAGDGFLQQVSEDLGMFAEHAGRRIIDETDVVAAMRK